MELLKSARGNLRIMRGIYLPNGVKLSVLKLVCFVSAIVWKSFVRYKIYDVRINKNATY